MKTQKEIIDALKTLKEVCIENGECTKCPLRSKEFNCQCELKLRFPSAWEFNEPLDCWSAFKQ